MAEIPHRARVPRSRESTCRRKIRHWEEGPSGAKADTVDGAWLRGAATDIGSLASSLSCCDAATRTRVISSLQMLHGNQYSQSVVKRAIDESSRRQASSSEQATPPTAVQRKAKVEHRARSHAGEGQNDPAALAAAKSEDLFALYATDANIHFLTGGSAYTREWVRRQGDKVIRDVIRGKLDAKLQQGRRDHLEWFLRFIETMPGDEGRKVRLRQGVEYRLRKLPAPAGEKTAAPGPQAEGGIVSVPEPESLSGSLSVEQMSQGEFHAEIARIDDWVAAYPGHPENERLRSIARVLQEEARRKAQRRFTTMGGGGGDALELKRVMGAIDGIQPAGGVSGVYRLTLDGQEFTLAHADAEMIRAKARLAIGHAAVEILRKARQALQAYGDLLRVNLEHPVASGAVHLFTDLEDPGKELHQDVELAILNTSLAMDMAGRNRFRKAASMIISAERLTKSADRLANTYRRDIISAGEDVVERLEITRDVAFFTLAVMAPFAAPASAALATGIATGAPIVGTLGSAGMQLALGEKVDWGQVTIDVAFAVVSSRFGSTVQGRLAKALGRIPGVGRLGGEALRKVVAGVITDQGAAAFKLGVDTTYGALSGKKVTWDRFIDKLVDQLTDPKSLFVSVVTQSASAYGEIRRARGAESSSGPVATREGAEASPPTVQAPEPATPGEVPTPETTLPAATPEGGEAATSAAMTSEGTTLPSGEGALSSPETTTPESTPPSAEEAAPPDTIPDLGATLPAAPESAARGAGPTEGRPAAKPVGGAARGGSHILEPIQDPARAAKLRDKFIREGRGYEASFKPEQYRADWHALGGHGEAPPAYIRDDGMLVFDIERVGEPPLSVMMSRPPAKAPTGAGRVRVGQGGTEEGVRSTLPEGATEPAATVPDLSSTLREDED